MKLICVGGVTSGCGKTSIVSLLLKALPGWGAVKVTPCRPGDVCPLGDECGACQPPESPYEIITDQKVLSQPGKDTARFLEAGASHVVWVRALPEYLPMALASALAEFRHVPGVVVESTTALPMLDGLKILVVRPGVSEIKESARRCLDTVDLVALNIEEGNAVDVPNFLQSHRRDQRVYMNAVLPPDDPSNTEFVETCRARLSQAQVSWRSP